MLRFKYCCLIYLIISCFSLADLHGQKDEININSLLQQDLQNSNITYNVDTIILQPDTIRVVDTVVVFIEEERPDWDLVLEFSTFYPYSTYSLKDQEFQNGLAAVNREINPITSYSYSFEINWTNNNWIINTGISYTELREQVNHNPTNLLVTERTYFQDEVIDEYYVVYNNDTTWYSSIISVEYTAIDSNYLNLPYINKYAYLEIPIGIGRQFQFRNFSGAILMGWSIGFHLNSGSAKHLSLDNNGDLINVTQNDDFNRSILAYYTSIRLCYPLSNKLKLVARPYYKWYFEDIFGKEFPYSKKANVFGIGLGINYSIK